MAAGVLADAAPALAYSLPCWDADCPDPTGWANERAKPHAKYPPLDGANCTNYVAWNLIYRGYPEWGNRLWTLGDAGQWAASAQAPGSMPTYVVNSTPTVGCVAQWDAGTVVGPESGHVAIVEAVRPDGSLEISESNMWLGGAKRWLDRQVIAPGSRYPSHFIHIHDGTASGDAGEEEDMGIPAYQIVGELNTPGYERLVGPRNHIYLLPEHAALLRRYKAGEPLLADEMGVITSLLSQVS